MDESLSKDPKIEETAPDGQPVDALAEADPESEAPVMEWYILKVQSNREDSIASALKRRAKIANLDEYFGEIVVPIESVTEVRNGRRRTTKHKLYPGYIILQMAITEDTWYLVRQTSGIGDFAGAAGKPMPMLPEEVERILSSQQQKEEEAPALKIGFQVGDRVKVKEGNFESMDGEVSSIDMTSGRVNVMINFFGRSTPVELEYWQIELL